MSLKSKLLSRKGIALIILAAVVLTALIYIAANPKGMDAVLYNLRAKELPMNTDPWEGGRELLHIPYAEKSGSQYLDLYLPASEEKLPLLVLIHGGGFLFEDCQNRQSQWMYRYFRDHGYACATVNYRLAQEAAFPAAVEDAKAAVRFLRANADEYGIDADRIAIFGESAGGYIAAMAAFTPEDKFGGMPFTGQGDQEVSAQVSVLVDYYGLMEFGSMAADYRQEGIPAWLNRAANYGMNIPKVKAAGYDGGHDYFLRVKSADIGSTDLSEYLPASYVSNLVPGEKMAILVHGELDLNVPVLQSQRLAASLTARLGEENVYTLYPYNSRHADDNLYTDEILADIQAHMENFWNSLEKEEK